jgi:hypothetical protein
MRIDTHISYGVEMDVFVRLYKPLDKQYQELTDILLSKFNTQVVDEVMVYVKQKVDWKQKLPFKEWPINGVIIEVVSGAGDEGVRVLVRRTQ